MWKSALKDPTIWAVVAMLTATIITSELYGSAPCFQECAERREEAIGVCVNRYNEDRTTRLSDCIQLVKEEHKQCIIRCSKDG